MHLTNCRPFWVSKKCGASVTLEHEQHKKAKANMETTPVQSMSVPKRTLAEAVHECERKRSPPPARKADVAWPTVGPTS